MTGSTRGARAGSGARVRPRRFASYESALKFLDARTNVERVNPGQLKPGVFKLDRMRAILAAMGDPHEDFPSVHVAGSKGKGSIAEMVASSMTACGYAAGVYTSPHLIDVRERVRLGGEVISKEDFIACLGRAAAAATHVETKHGPASYFELVTALAFRYFAERAVDVAVIEVGLGGRLDSTNVIAPKVVGIGAIQLEHTQLLGSTVEAIAREKAGVFKPGVPAVTMPQAKPIMEVLRASAAEVGCELRVLGEQVDFSWRFEASPELGPHTRVCVSNSKGAYEHLPVPLPGEHQAMNCGIALAILSELRDGGFELPERLVAEGLSRTPRNGRAEQVWDAPRILVDGAHTPDSLEAAVKGVGAHLRYDSMVIVFGCAADKDSGAMLEKVGIGADKVIFTRASDNPRAADPHELHRRFVETQGKMAQVADTVKEAINVAARAVGRDDLILVTGSFYVAGEAKRLLAEKRMAASEVEAKG